MTTNDDVSVEVSGGYVLVAFKIPILTCGGCGRTVAQKTVESSHMKSLIMNHQPITCFFMTPEGWTHAYPKGMAAVLVCPDCAAPINEVKLANERAEEAAHLVVASRILSGAGK